MARTRRPRRPRRGARPKRRWTAQLANGVNVANNLIQSISLVDFAQYQSVVGVEKEGPTAGPFVFGNLEYVPTLAAAHSVWLCVVKMDSAATTLPDPANANSMAEFDILWWTMRGVTATTNNVTFASDAGGPPKIKAKRKLERTAIRLVYSSVGGAAGNTGLLYFSERTLLLGDIA